jgi:HSP20 family molecular chaperone IbpA
MPHGMPRDVYKRENAWHVEMDLPGVDPGSIDLLLGERVRPLVVDLGLEIRERRVRTSAGW